MITITKVWKVNNRLVVADTAINAIMIYTDYFGSVPGYSSNPAIHSVLAVDDDDTPHGYDALIREPQTPKWLYRMESTDPDNGLWYNSKGNFCFEKGIGSLDDSCKTKKLPMDYDARYRQNGRMWFSSCSKQEDLLHWFSKKDAEELKKKGFRFFKYLATEYHEYPQETVFIKETCLAKLEIPIDEFFGVDSERFIDGL